jgi:hypothetical protein
LCRHMAQGTNGAGCFCRELKNDRHPGREGGWRKLRGEHGKKRVKTFQANWPVVNPETSRREWISFAITA